MPILDEFQRLCCRVVKCRAWWKDASDKEREAQKANLYILADLIDETYMQMNENEKEEALLMLKLSFEGELYEN